MAKKNILYTCSECGYKSSSGYLGRCPECGSWGTLVEDIVSSEKSNKTKRSISAAGKAEKLSSIKKSSIDRISTGSKEFDRVLGGGIVSDSVNILSAPPGMGKSTILLQLSNYIATNYGSVLYVSGEESVSQIKSRSDRVISSLSDNLYIYSECMVESIISEIERLSPVFVVIDSLQVMYSSSCDGTLYGDKQALTCVNMLISKAKGESPFSMFIIGQMTKEDELRGTREIEHAVDAVFYLDKIQDSSVRFIKSVKNRFGNTEEVGMLEMTESGLIDINDPSMYFVSLHKTPQVGCALFVTKEGSRNIIAEVESLTCANVFAYPQRVSRGLYTDQLKLLLAILERKSSIKTDKKDVYVQIGGGLKVSNDSALLASSAAIYSSIKNVPIPQDTVFVGGVGLTGHIKSIPQIELIIKDCQRFGFKHIVIPNIKSIDESKYTINVVKVETINDLIKFIGS